MEQKNAGNKMSTSMIMVNPYYVILHTSSEESEKCVHADRISKTSGFD